MREDCRKGMWVEMKDVLASKDLIMDALEVAGLPHRDEFEMEDQNQEYEGFVLTLDDWTYRSRRARKTPKRVISLSFGERVTMTGTVHIRWRKVRIASSSLSWTKERKGSSFFRKR